MAPGETLGCGWWTGCAGRGSITPTRSVVLDDRGVRIGVWYSWLPPMPVQLLDDGGVVIAAAVRAPGGLAATPELNKAD